MREIVARLIERAREERVWGMTGKEMLEVAEDCRWKKVAATMLWEESRSTNTDGAALLPGNLLSARKFEMAAEGRCYAKL